MSDPFSGQINPRYFCVSAAVVHSLARGAIAREQERSGVTKEVAAGVIARRIQEAPGTVINLYKARAKTISATVRDKISAYVVREIQAEIKRLEHELLVARQIADRPDAAAILQADALLRQAREIMEGRK